MASADIPISALTVLDERDDLVTVTAVDEDDAIHMITARPGGRVSIDTVPSGHEAVTRCLSLPPSAHGPRLVTTSFAGEIRIWDVNGPQVSLARRIRLPEEPLLAVPVESAGRPLLAFTAPGGIIFWDVSSGADTPTLVRTGGRRPSHLVAVGTAQSRRIVCAYASGSLAVIDPATGAISELELNCPFTHLTGMTNPNWAIGSHGAALVARPPPSRSGANTPAMPGTV